MENKCNKTPNSNNKYLDHVYCHSNEGKNYIRANNNGSGGGNGGTTTTGVDLMALVKENKQLKAMLILHLDLIQEQSDQLIAKDKKLASLNTELETLRSKNSQLETHVIELQRQLQRQIKRTALAAGEISSIPPPPLAKIQCKKEVIPTTNIIGECNGKLISKIILHRVSVPRSDGTRSPHSTTASETYSETEDSISRAHNDEQDHEEETENTTEDSNDTSSASIKSKPQRSKMTNASGVSRGAKPRQSIGVTPASSSGPAQVCVTPPTPSRGKHMPLMLWHTPDIHSDESASCDSLADVDQRSASVASPATENTSGDTKNNKSSGLAPPVHSHGRRHAKFRRCAYISTPEMYSTREWEDEEYSCDLEFIKEEASVLYAEAPMLEVPKWTEHELSPLYSIEGTEDLSDDTFHKRHSKLEVDEKRRKKWDVQQIREQRRIEKLKRRHCKDELQAPTEQQPLTSFYPHSETIQSICFVNDLPVQAFGEMIPKLGVQNAEYALPWLETTLTASTVTAVNTATTNSTVATVASSNLCASSTQAQQQMLNSSFVLLKRRRRHQSHSYTTASLTARQKSVAAAKVATHTVTAAAPSAPPAPQNIETAN